jgi:hypothetical protein
MPRYLVLRFEHDDEFGMFPDDLRVMLEELSNPPYVVEIVGEGIPYILYEDEYMKVIPIGQTDTQAT